MYVLIETIIQYYLGRLYYHIKRSELSCNLFVNPQKLVGFRYNVFLPLVKLLLIVHVQSTIRDSVEIEQSDSCLCENPCSATQYPFKISMLELRESTIDKLKKDHPIPETLTKYDRVTTVDTIALGAQPYVFEPHWLISNI